MIDQAPYNSAAAECALQPLVIGVDEFAALLQVSNRTIWRLVSSGEAPEPIRFGGSCRWRIEEVKNWIELGCPSQNTK